MVGKGSLVSETRNVLLKHAKVRVINDDFTDVLSKFPFTEVCPRVYLWRPLRELHHEQHIPAPGTVFVSDGRRISIFEN